MEIPLEGKTVEPEETGKFGSGWQNIMTEDFEGVFPGSKWDVYSQSQVDAYWGKDSYNPHNGSWSAYCAKSGTDGVDPPAWFPYRMSSAMVYGPFSLADATDAELRFHLWLDSAGIQVEPYNIPGDYLLWAASIDGKYFGGKTIAGHYRHWMEKSLDFTEIPYLGNVCGQPEVWILFTFSDVMPGSSGQGAFIDDVVLSKYVGGEAEDCPWLDEEPKSGMVPPGEEDDITVTFDTTGLGSTYTANIVILSNDPDEPEVTVPVTLTVTTGVAPSVSISAPAEVGAGSDFIARVNIDGVENFDAANYDVVFDDTVLRLDDVTAGEIDGTAIPVDIWNLEDGGSCTIVQNVPGLAGVTGSGTLAELHFHVIGAEGDSSDIGLQNGFLGDNGANEIEATWTGDSVHVSSILPGDANGDGVVNSLDITKVERIIVGLDAETPGADANGDGVVNSLDITKVERIIVGLD